MLLGNRMSIAGITVITAVSILAVAGCNDKSEQLEQQLVSQQMQLTELQESNNKLVAELKDSQEKAAALTTEKEQLAEEGKHYARIDQEIPADVVAFLFRYLHTVQLKPDASAKVWRDYFVDSERTGWFIDAILSRPELSYAKFTYQGETTYTKPGISNRILGINAFKANDEVDAYSLSNVNNAGWKIVDVD
ncbi:hypothetical protein [Paenibacillus sp. CF384]|uniref:hypothetical protein n=1 Tax=Paenibacillus sp. CF384 TaxID=1884382 RepID=UPI00089B47CC|nr:hypothetical protein [Paenibacillus sp. CF384]SDW54601.1 hypothetical protein SAMN05518855_100337 [Paenibacillus sp. CF384]